MGKLKPIFSDCEAPATEVMVRETEARLGLQFPAELRWLFMNANGGRPEPYVCRSGNGSTAVNTTLPLKPGSGSAAWYYERMLHDGRIPRHLFPFASDPGGNMFLVDCTSLDAQVFFWHHDTCSQPLVALDVGLVRFWECLEPE